LSQLLAMLRRIIRPLPEIDDYYIHYILTLLADCRRLRCHTLFRHYAFDISFITLPARCRHYSPLTPLAPVFSFHYAISIAYACHAITPIAGTAELPIRSHYAATPRLTLLAAEQFRSSAPHD